MKMPSTNHYSLKTVKNMYTLIYFSFIFDIKEPLYYANNKHFAIVYQEVPEITW